MLPGAPVTGSTVGIEAAWPDTGRSVTGGGSVIGTMFSSARSCAAYGDEASNALKCVGVIVARHLNERMTVFFL